MTINKQTFPINFVRIIALGMVIAFTAAWAPAPERPVDDSVEGAINYYKTHPPAAHGAAVQHTVQPALAVAPLQPKTAQSQAEEQLTPVVTVHSSARPQQKVTIIFPSQTQQGATIITPVAKMKPLPNSELSKEEAMPAPAAEQQAAPVGERQQPAVVARKSARPAAKPAIPMAAPAAVSEEASTTAVPVESVKSMPIAAKLGIIALTALVMIGFYYWHSSRERQRTFDEQMEEARKALEDVAAAVAAADKNAAAKSKKADKAEKADKNDDKKAAAA